MKKIVLSIIVLISVFTASAQKYQIKGELTGLKDGTVLELVPGATHRTEKAVDSAVIKDGKFIFKGTIEYPSQFMIRPKNAYSLVSVVVAAGDKLTIKGSVSENKGHFSANNFQYSGSKTQQAYLSKMQVREQLDILYNENEKKHAAVSAKMSTARSNKDQDEMAKIQASAEWKAMENDNSAFFVTVEERYKKLLVENKDSWWGPLLALNIYNFFPSGSEYLYDQLAVDAQNSHYGQLLKAQVKPDKLTGKQAPTIKAKDRNGNTLDFAALANGKKYILIDFWASWCAPCRKKIPELKAFYEKHKNNGLEILAISIDKKEADWVKASEEEKFLYADYYDLGGTADNWNVRAIPALFLVDSTGKVVADNIQLANLEKILMK